MLSWQAFPSLFQKKPFRTNSPRQPINTEPTTIPFFPTTEFPRTPPFPIPQQFQRIRAMTNPLHRSDTLDTQRLVGQQRPNSCVGICRVSGRSDALFSNNTALSTTSSSSDLSSNITMTSLHTSSRHMASSRSDSRQHRWMRSEPQERSPSKIIKRCNRGHSRRRMSAILRMWRVRDLLFLFGTCSRGDDHGHTRNNRWLVSSFFNLSNFSSLRNLLFYFFLLFVIFSFLLFFCYFLI